MICHEDIRNAVTAEASKHAVSRAWLFGSYARGNADEQSDVDIAIEPAKGLTILSMSAMRIGIEERLGVPVDLVSRNGLFPYVRNSFERDGVLLYERA